MQDSLKLAAANIFRFGDTDIFPIPIENVIIYDQIDDVVTLVRETMQPDFDAFLVRNPPSNIDALSPAGYTGYRWATQIDPIWNLYFLACVIEIGEHVENARLDSNYVSAYRFLKDTTESKLFDTDIGWRHFQTRSLELASSVDPADNDQAMYGYVLICDIADFYPRIYQHKMDNALDRLGIGNDIPSRIKKQYDAFSGLPSYGLPIGGPAARLLAELLLNSVDRLLVSNEVNFVRFCDDYHIFARTKSEAYRHLAFLAEKLLRMEGLALQKSKSRIMTAQEFIANSKALQEDEENPERSDFMKLRLKFDPYSATAADDYEALRAEIGNFDILDLLTKELNKSHIHRSGTAHIINAIRFLGDVAKQEACLAMIKSLDVMAPIFGLVMRTLKEIIGDLDDEARKQISAAIRQIINSKSHLVAVDTNMAYAVRVLAHHHCTENETLLVQIYRSPASELVRKDIVIAMARWRCAYFIEDAKNSYHQETPWVQRALIIASYAIGDSGSHWRRIVPNLAGFNGVVREWMAARGADHDISTLPL